MSSDEPAGRSGPSRRALLGAALGTAGAAAVGGAGFATARVTDTDHQSSGGTVPFYGARQAGIATPAQDRLAFAAFDITTSDIRSIMGMLGSWSAAAARMAVGEPIGPTETRPQAPPVDTGEAMGLDPGKLTITVGFGPSFFDDRFGMAHRRPAALADLPPMTGDSLDPNRSGGDLCVQACSEDPQVAFHVIRNFARIGRGTVVMRWSQLGFGRTSSTSKSQETPRNLMGFKDGTNNIKAEDTDDFDDYVWVGDEADQSWMRGGSYLVARRIRMLIEPWDADYIADQERTFGRRKISGAPLTGTHEFDHVQLAAKKPDGTPVIPVNAHIRLAAPSNNHGQKLLRRGYSYTDGTDPRTGQLDAGLFFIVFCQDPGRQFVPIQRKLGHHDLLNEYITHTGSALFAVPPGVQKPGDWFGKGLLG
ncbi:MAG: iron uptake transporter deferrochelatase/peroxidase subunit [Nocardioidaceae bacterium]